MNENEQMLSENLRGLAEDGPQEAPARVEERLMAEFRRRSRARRITTWTISGAAAVAAGVALMLWIRPAPPAANRAATGRERYHGGLADQYRGAPKNKDSVTQAVFPESKPTVPPTTEPPKPRTIQKTAPVRAAMSFYPLPEAEGLPPVENATVVRVRLPMSSLRLIGFPVNEERAAERIQADVLVGQDGLARGVRFVQ